MWLDMWILPNYIEAERSGCLQGWLLEHAPQGSSNMNYQIIAGGSPETQAQEEKPFSGSISAGRSAICFLPFDMLFTPFHRLHDLHYIVLAADFPQQKLLLQ